MLSVADCQDETRTEKPIWFKMNEHALEKAGEENVWRVPDTTAKAIKDEKENRTTCDFNEVDYSIHEEQPESESEEEEEEIESEEEDEQSEDEDSGSDEEDE